MTRAANVLAAVVVPMVVPLVLAGGCVSYDALRAPRAGAADGGRPADVQSHDGPLATSSDAVIPGTGAPSADGSAPAPADGAPGPRDGSSDDPRPAPSDGPPPKLDAPGDPRPPADAPSDPPPAPVDTAPTAQELAFGCPPDAELRACFTFDDIGAGTLLVDHSGRGNHGFLNTALVAAGVSGAGLSFTEPAQYATLPDATSLRLAGEEATFEAWLRPTGSPSDNGADYIIGKVNTTYQGWAFAIYLGEARVYVDGVTGRGGGPLTFGFWNHVSVVLARSGVLVYINGQRVSEVLAPLAIPAITDALTVGNARPELAAPLPDRHAFHGEIDVLRIYGRARRPEEICAAADRVWTAAGACTPRAVSVR